MHDAYKPHKQTEKGAFIFYGEGGDEGFYFLWEEKQAHLLCGTKYATLLIFQVHIGDSTFGTDFVETYKELNAHVVNTAYKNKSIKTFSKTFQEQNRWPPLFSGRK